MSPTPVTRPQNLPQVQVGERSHRDPSFLDLKGEKPGRHYRWVRCRTDEHMMSIIKTKLAGYTVERYEPGGVEPIVEVVQSDRRPDGVISVGDLILMSCPEELWQHRQDNQRRKTEGLLAATSAQTEEMAKAKGIKMIKDPDHS